MTYLLDINILLALSDRVHPLHKKAKDWYHSHHSLSWSTCPITENGFIRIGSQHSYDGKKFTPDQMRKTLDNLCSQPGHQFWPDDLSPRDTESIQSFPGHKTITDLYLLALAVKHKGKFASMDEGIDASLVLGGTEAFVLVG